jgi:hypothetical protein
MAEIQCSEELEMVVKRLAQSFKRQDFGHQFLFLRLFSSDRGDLSPRINLIFILILILNLTFIFSTEKVFQRIPNNPQPIYCTS